MAHLASGLGWALTHAGVAVVLLLLRRLAALVIFGVAEAGSTFYLQVHWLSDVIGGTLLGSGIARVTFAVGELLTVARQGGVRGTAAR